MRRFCTHCTTYSEISDKLSCTNCGKVVGDIIFSDEITFHKSADGRSQYSGRNYNWGSDQSASYDLRIKRGDDEISYIVNALRISGGESIEKHAGRFYKIAVDTNFTKGRSVTHIAAACLYLACRQTKKPYLLIDFSDHVRVNVYVLGAVFLQLCKLLMLEKDPLINPLVDPSLFIHRFTESLLGERNNAVSDTALRIIASMKRDWIQTGRKPSGLCGAALYISALSHGLNYSKSDIVKVVHVCEATVTKRLVEFENTESGCLSIEEFLARSSEIDEETQNQLPLPGELLCKHKDDNATHFAHGLCRSCYDEFVNISGGMRGGADPPAFQRAEWQRENQMDDEDMEPPLAGGSSAKEKSPPNSKEATSFEIDDVDAPVRDASGDCDKTEESEDLNDIDDREVDGYIHNEEERKFKKIIWEEMNKEYEEEQAAKKAAADKELSGDGTSGKPKKERKKRRAKEVGNSNPAGSAYDATSGILMRKVSSTRINIKALKHLFEDGESRKKLRNESDPSDVEDQNNDTNKEEIEQVIDSEAADEANVDEGFNLGDIDEDEYAHGGGEYEYGLEADRKDF